MGEEWLRVEERQKRGRTQRKIFDVRPAQTKSQTLTHNCEKIRWKAGIFIFYFFMFFGGDDDDDDNRRNVLVVA